MSKAKGAQPRNWFLDRSGSGRWIHSPVQWQGRIWELLCGWRRHVRAGGRDRNPFFTRLAPCIVDTADGSCRSRRSTLKSRRQVMRRLLVSKGKTWARAVHGGGRSRKAA